MDILVKYAVEKSGANSYISLVTSSDVQNLRKSLGLSVRAFARLLKVDHMTVARAEQRGPTREFVLIVERCLSDGSLKLSDKKAKPE